MAAKNQPRHEIYGSSSTKRYTVGGETKMVGEPLPNGLPEQVGSLS